MMLKSSFWSVDRLHWVTATVTTATEQVFSTP